MFPRAEVRRNEVGITHGMAMSRLRHFDINDQLFFTYSFLLIVFINPNTGVWVSKTERLFLGFLKGLVLFFKNKFFKIFLFFIYLLPYSVIL